METDRKPAAVFHPAVFIKEEMQARGWDLDKLAEAMANKELPIFRERQRRVNRLAIELFLTVGPTDPNHLLDPYFADRLDFAFGTTPQFWLNLWEAWKKARG